MVLWPESQKSTKHVGGAVSSWCTAVVGLTVLCFPQLFTLTHMAQRNSITRHRMNGQIPMWESGNIGSFDHVTVARGHTFFGSLEVCFHRYMLNKIQPREQGSRFVLKFFLQVCAVKSVSQQHLRRQASVVHRRVIDVDLDAKHIKRRTPRTCLIEKVIRLVRNRTFV